MFSKLSTVLILFSVFCAALCELSVSAYRGERANIECPYTADNIFSLKYFFKMTAGHNNEIYTLNRRRFLQKGRVSITDDHQRKILQVSIDSLSESDSGLYACAVGKGHSVETFAVVRLSVMMAPQIKINSVRSLVPTERSFIKHAETSKSDKVTVQEPFTPTLPAVTETLNETDYSDWRWMALYVGTSVVIVAVLSSVLILVSCFRLRRRSLQNTRQMKSACKGNSETERTENQYKESNISSKHHASIYQDLNRKQSDTIYQCLSNRNNLKN